MLRTFMMISGIDRPTRLDATESPRAGFTVLELLFVTMLIVTLSAIAVPFYFDSLKAARNVRARADIKNISTTIDVRYLTTGLYPNTLADVGCDQMVDPWGRPYQYLKIQGLKNKGQARTDKNLVPINADYDLYSMGKDGKSDSPLTANDSLDDIVRGNNGAFIGVAVNY
jgi:general secretion pathway protein G